MGLVEAAPEHAANVAALEQRQIERNAANWPRREADHEQPALPAERAKRSLGEVAADRIEDDVDALCAADLLQAVFQIILRIVEENIGAVLPAELELLVRRGAGDDAKSHKLAGF